MTNSVFKKTAVAVALLAAGVALGWAVSQWRTASSHASSAVPASVRSGEGRPQGAVLVRPHGANAEVRQARQVALHGHGLVPKYADEDTQENSGLSVSAQAVQALGLRTATVEQRDIGSDVDVLGTVQLNDRDVSIVQAALQALWNASMPGPRVTWWPQERHWPICCCLNGWLRSASFSRSGRSRKSR